MVFGYYSTLVSGGTCTGSGGSKADTRHFGDHHSIHCTGLRTGAWEPALILAMLHPLWEETLQGRVDERVIVLQIKGEGFLSSPSQCREDDNQSRLPFPETVVSLHASEFSRETGATECTHVHVCYKEVARMLPEPGPASSEVFPTRGCSGQCSPACGSLQGNFFLT